MKSSIYYIVIGVVFLALTGCASHVSKNKNLAVKDGFLLNTNNEEDVRDAASALKAVTGAMSEKSMTDKELYDAAKKMKNDPEAKSAVDAISSSFDKKDVKIKYSPATGKRYSAEMEYDPETGVKLLPVE